MATAILIDFAAARRARLCKQATSATFSPFESTLLKAYADQLPPELLEVMKAAVADGFAAGRTTGRIVSSIRRDAVRQAARAAL